MEYKTSSFMAKKLVMGIAFISLIVSFVSAVEENEGAPGFAPDFEPGLAPDFEPGLAPEYAPWFQPGYAPGLAPGDRSGGKVGVCWNIRCKESKECDSFCRDAGYSGGLCLPPAKICCCVY